MLTRYIAPEKGSWDAICKRPALAEKSLEATISEVFKEVATNGDAAIAAYTKKFDGVVLENFKLKNQSRDALAMAVDEDLKNALIHAKDNIWKFHESQISISEKVEVQPGIVCWQKALPIEKVALYIPGGSAPLFSTVLMLAVPAKIAGVREINIFTPPNSKGEIHPAIALAAKLSGVDNIFLVGGAQAIAAAAIGTQQIPKCDKIFGPGNQFVTAAKMRAMSMGIPIDMPAGPSEVLVWADKKAKAKYVAADLLSQAEHGADSQCVVLCNSADFVDQVEVEIQKQLDVLPRKDIATKALENSFAVVLESQIDQIAFSNHYAPEHLIIQVENYEELAINIENAGSVFLGPYSPESAGDYASGTNHTLPTAGFAKSYSGVNLASFQKLISFQNLTQTGLNDLATTVITMAENEGLQAHANAVKIRQNEI